MELIGERPRLTTGVIHRPFGLSQRGVSLVNTILGARQARSAVGERRASRLEVHLPFGHPFREHAVGRGDVAQLGQQLLQTSGGDIGLLGQMTLAIPRHLKPGLCLRHLNLAPRTRFANLILLSLDRGESRAPLRESAGRALEATRKRFQPLIEIIGATGQLASPRRHALNECVERLELPARAPDVTLGFRPALIGTTHLLMGPLDRKSTRLNSSHGYTSYAVF